MNLFTLTVGSLSDLHVIHALKTMNDSLCCAFYNMQNYSRMGLK